MEARLNAIGLSLAKLFALRALAEAGEPDPLGQLAERLACVKSNITQLVDRLEADGLVARKPAANDRRTKLASLTAAGRRAYEDGDQGAARRRARPDETLVGRRDPAARVATGEVWRPRRDRAFFLADLIQI